jgi:hypothetical protein
VADAAFGLDVIDVSTPTAPAKIGFLAMTDIRGVAVQASFAYCIGPDGLHVVDISNPASPIEVASRPTFVGHDAVVVDSLLYVAGSPFRIINVNDPANPVQVGALAAGPGLNVAVSGQHAYLAAWNAAVIINVADPAHPFQTGSFKPSNAVYDVAVSDNLMFVANYINGLYVRDVSDQYNPVRFYNYDTADNLDAVATQGDLVFIADRYYGLKILDASDPARPRVIGSVDTESAYDVAVDGNRAYIADWQGGFRIIDVADPTQPSEVGFFETGGAPYSVAILGNLAFIGDYGTGVRILDVTNPSSVVEVGSWNGFSYDGSAYDIALAPERAFVASGYDGFRILDVSNPSTPVEIPASPYVYFPPYEAYGVTTAGSTAYAATTEGIVTPLFFNPNEWFPVRMSAVSGTKVSISGGLACVASGSQGIRFLDAGSGVETGYYITESSATDVSAARGYVFGVSAGEGLFILERAEPVPVTLQLFDIEPVAEGIRATWRIVDEQDIAAYRLLRGHSGSEPGIEIVTLPVSAGGAARYDYLDSSALRGVRYSYTLVAVENDGTSRVLGSSEGMLPAVDGAILEQNVPNPFNPETQIRVRLPEAADVDLAIYDVSGRFVVQLARGREPAGTRTFNWSGTGARGERVASGVYVCRLQAGKQMLTRKLVLLR